MDTTRQHQLTELEDSEMVGLVGGFTGSGPLAHDIGALIGGAVGAFMKIGEALYRNGGLTGGNTWLRR